MVNQRVTPGIWQDQIQDVKQKAMYENFREHCSQHNYFPLVVKFVCYSTIWSLRRHASVKIHSGKHQDVKPYLGNQSLIV